LPAKEIVYALVSIDKRDMDGTLRTTEDIANALSDTIETDVPFTEFGGVVRATGSLIHVKDTITELQVEESSKVSAGKDSLMPIDEIRCEKCKRNHIDFQDGNTDRLLCEDCATEEGLTI
jgi:hypothetical protein